MINSYKNTKITAESNDKISRLIALPLLKKEFPLGNLPDFKIDTIINIQKMINIRAEKDMARQVKGLEYYGYYVKDLSKFFNKKIKFKKIILTKEDKILALKKDSDNNLPRAAHIKIPVLKRLGDTIDNFIFEEKNKILNNKKKIFNYILPSWVQPTVQEVKREIIFKTHNYIKSVTRYSSNLAENTNVVYSFNKKKNNFFKIQNIYSLLHYSFHKMCGSISTPIFLISHKKIKIQVWFFWSPDVRKRILKSKFYSKFLLLNNEQLSNLGKSLSKYLKQPVELELIRLYAPQLDSTVFVNLIGFIVNYTKYKLIRQIIFRIGYTINATKLKIRTRKMNPIIPSVLTGIKLRLAGRFMNQRYYQRVRNREIQRGSLTRNNAKLVNLSRIHGKSRRGAYSVTVTSGYSIID